MVFSKLLLVTWTAVWACLWGAGPGDGAFHALRDQGPGDGAFRHHVFPQVSHDHRSSHDRRSGHDRHDHHGHYLTSLSDVSDAHRLEQARVSFLRYRWPNKVVPISFASNFAEEYKAKVYEAMDVISTLTCIRFRNTTNSTGNFQLLVSREEDGCFAQYGYVKLSRGFQVLNLDQGCHDFAVIVHELLHALGIDHEQSRVDRNNYVKIFMDHIAEIHRQNFMQRNGTDDFKFTMGLPYDYNSIMHYPPDCFALNKDASALEPKKPFSGILGQHYRLSRTDIAKLNRYYECWDYYLGDDIPDAVPYVEFHYMYIKQHPGKTAKGILPPPMPLSDTFQKWLSFMKLSLTK